MNPAITSPMLLSISTLSNTIIKKAKEGKKKNKHTFLMTEDTEQFLCHVDRISIYGWVKTQIPQNKILT